MRVVLVPPTERADIPRGLLQRSATAVKLAALLLGAAVGLGCGSHAPEPVPPPSAPEASIPVPPAPAPRDLAVLDVEGFGEIRFELLGDMAPRAVAHFEKLAQEDFYDGTTFHRVIPDFMIQGGDPNTKDRDPRNDGLGDAGDTLPDELSRIGHVRGIVSMANTGRRNSSSSQFFIVVADSAHLDGKYTVFGRVISGMDVVDKIVAVERDIYGRWGPPDRPRQNVTVRDVRIEPAAGSGH